MSFSREKRETIKQYMLEKIADGSHGIIGRTEETFAVSRNTASRYMRELIAEGVVEKRKSGYVLVTKTETYRLDMHDPEVQSEDRVFDLYIEPFMTGLPENVRQIWAYCFSEMMNNVIDHSGADKAVICIAQDHLHTGVILQDDGVGIFHKIRDYYQFPTLDDAILELFKGKLTTDSDHHSGEGIFFTSRMLDVFAAISNGKVFSHSEYDTVLENLDAYPEWKDTALLQKGTCIFMKLNNHSRKTAKEIMDLYADVDGGFTKTQIPLKYIFSSYPVSRSQAKRLTHRFEDFEEVELDFSGIDEIGQGFAHELFVVFRKRHPDIRLIPYNTNVDVQRMIYHVTAGL